MFPLLCNFFYYPLSISLAQQGLTGRSDFDVEVSWQYCSNWMAKNSKIMSFGNSVEARTGTDSSAVVDLNVWQETPCLCLYMLRHTSRVSTSLWNWHNSFIPSIAPHSNAVSRVSKPETLTSAGASDTDDVCTRKQDAAELPLITYMINVAAFIVPTGKEWWARGEIQSVASEASHFPFEWLWRCRAFEWRILVSFVTGLKWKLCFLCYCTATQRRRKGNIKSW